MAFVMPLVFSCFHEIFMALTIAAFKRFTFIGVSVFTIVFSNMLFASTDKNIDQLQNQLIDLRAVVDANSEDLSLLSQDKKKKRKLMMNQISEIKYSIEQKEIIM